MSLEKYTTRGNPPEDLENQILEETEQALHELQVDWQTFLIDAQVNESEVMTALKNDEIRAAFRLKPKESIETQRVGLAELEKSLASFALLLPAAARENTHSLSELLAHFPAEKVASFSPNLKVMMWKIRTLVRDPSSPMTGYLESQWDRTISRVPVSSEMHRGIEDMRAALSEGRRPEEGNSIMNMVKNHWGKFLLVGTAGYAVHKVFSLFGAGKKEEQNMGFFERFVSMIPGGQYTLGTTIALGGIYALFGGKIREWLPDEETLQALSDFIEKPSLTGFLALIQTIFGGKGNTVSGNKKGVREENFSVPPLPESPRARETVAETVAAARMYQGYYGIFRPLAAMTSLERKMFTGNASGGLHSDISYAESRSKLPELEQRYTFLSDPPESHFTHLEERFRREFHTGGGKHPLFGDIDLAIRELTPEQKALAGIVDDMPFEQRNTQFFRYLAVSVTNTELTTLGYHIEAIHAGQLHGVKAYNELMDVKKNPTLFTEKLQNIENARVAHRAGIQGVDHITREKLQAFLKLRETFQNTIAEKNTRVDTLVTDIRETMKHEGYTLPDKRGTPLTPEQLAKNQSLDQHLRPKLVEIAKLEKEVGTIATKFLTENESAIVRHLREQGTRRTTRYSILQKLGKAPEYAQITDFHTGPRQQWFRLSSLRGGMIVTGIGAGFALMNAPMGEKVDTALAVSGRIVGGMVPLLAEYLDANDAYESFKKGEVLNGVIYSGALVMDMASTVLLATGFLSWAGVGMKGAKSALIREAIKSGAVKTAEIEGKNLVMRGVNGEIIGKPILLESDEILSIKKMTDWIDMSRSASVKTVAHYGLIAGMVVTLGGTGAMIAGSFIGNDGKMEAKNFAPDIEK